MAPPYPISRRARVVDALIRAVGARSWFTPLGAEDLVHAARRRTSLTSLGEGDWEEPLRVILEDLQTDAELTDLGAVMAGRLLQGLLENRLRTWAAFQAQQPPLPQDPIIILGLPRTGSTLLHELLAQHGHLRAPLFWESESLPAGGWGDVNRRLSSRAHTSLINLLAPQFRWIHRVAAARPHECVTIQALSFRSMQLHALLRLPRYTRWLAACDWQPAYLWHARYLALLGATGPGRRWLLKAPGHMHGIEALLDRYPGAQFVQLHREAEACIPSMASLYAALRATTRQRVDAADIGRHICTEWCEGLKRVRAARQRPEVNDRFLDVSYADLVAQPLETAATICAFADVSFDSDQAKPLREYLRRNRKSGRHRYTLEQFDLDAEAIRQAFAAD